MSWAEKCFHLLLELPNKPFKWSTMPIPWLEINCWKSENAKMTQNGLSSPKCIFWLQPYRSFKKSTRNLRGINYQMEYMWWAPHNNKNSPGLQLGSQLRCTLYHSFIVTLYTPTQSFKKLWGGVVGWGGGGVVGWLKILVTAQVLGIGIWDLDWTLDLGLSIIMHTGKNRKYNIFMTFQVILCCVSLSVIPQWLVIRLHKSPYCNEMKKVVIVTVTSKNMMKTITRLGVDKVKPKGWFKYF